VWLTRPIGWTCEDKSQHADADPLTIRGRLVDEEVVMPGGYRPIAAGPVDEKRLAGLIRSVVAAAGMDLEFVRVTVAGKRRLLRVVVDSDRGVSLDDAADVSREVSAMLDATDVMGEVPYTLEVSSPGVDRPLTEPRHWRRAVGRLIRAKVEGSGHVQGRVLAADSHGVTLDVDGARRTFEYGALGAGRIQVEFGRLPEAAQDKPLTDEALADEALADNNFPDAAPDHPEAGHSHHELSYQADLGAGGDGY
jgi:ribosome maturation factor RimP